MLNVTAADLQGTPLRYSTDSRPGFSRRKNGNHFDYYDLEGNLIIDENIVNRINGLAIPPSWEKVWISPNALGYLQATGRDLKGKKQYRYHDKWNQKSQGDKYSRMILFGQLLPILRQRITKDIKLRGLPREKVIATIVWLLEKTLIRVGNQEYAKENQSFGLTTLRRKHTKIRGDQVKFEFKGKSGVYHTISIRHRRVSQIIRKCHDLPGQDLFEYRNDQGQIETITSEDVNLYLGEVTGHDITAKDFRTWAGTDLAAELLDQAGLSQDDSSAKKILTETVKEVSSHLRNRPATCRKYYIQPIILACYNKGVIISNYQSKKKTFKHRLLSEKECKVIGMLQSI